MNKLRNTPVSIIALLAATVLGAVFNFTMGLILSLNPGALSGIDQPETAAGTPPTFILISGVACIAFGFVYVWVFKEILNKSPIVFTMAYTLVGLNILFGLFRLPLGFITISINLLTLLLIRSMSAKQWMASS